MPTESNIYTHRSHISLISPSPCPSGLTVPHRMKTRPLSLHCPTLVFTPLAQSGITALIITSTNGSLETLKALLAAKADVNAKNDVGGREGRGLASSKLPHLCRHFSL